MKTPKAKTGPKPKWQQIHEKPKMTADPEIVMKLLEYAKRLGMQNPEITFNDDGPCIVETCRFKR